MDQYVVHKGVYCQVHEFGWRVRQWTCDATGQRETIAWPRKVYVPLGDIDDPDVLAAEIDQSGTLLGEAREEERKLRRLERSRARRKKNCRHRIKSASFTSMLTATYRENMQDFDRMRSDWAKYLRLLSRYIPGFRAVYGFETQERGAWHVHAAIDRLPAWIEFKGQKIRSFKLLRELWHRVVGDDNGNIDVDGHRRTRHGFIGKYGKAESLARLAGYISKYLTKDYGDGVDGRNLWGSTQGLNHSKPVTFDMPEMPLIQLMELGFYCPDGHRVVRHSVGQFGKFWLLYTEPIYDDSNTS